MSTCMFVRSVFLRPGMAASSRMTVQWRRFSQSAADYNTKLRNIAIVSGLRRRSSDKSTLTKRILYHAGDGNASSNKTDSTDDIPKISAVTSCHWKDCRVNLIKSSALRVADGGVLVVNAAKGLDQDRSLQVSQEMKRFGVPRLAFVNQLDSNGSDPDRVVEELRDVLQWNAAAVQVPIGLESNHVGVVDLIEDRSYTFDGEMGEHVAEGSVPDDLAELVDEKKRVLLKQLAESDTEMAEFLSRNEVPDNNVLKAAIQRQVKACSFVPVFLGAAFKSKGVQPLLDGIVDYLPAPHEKANYALDRRNNSQVLVTARDSDPLLALAFKLDDRTAFDQPTYLRVYQGRLVKGKTVTNANNGKEVEISRMARVHSGGLEDIEEAGAGDVVAVFGVDARSMDTFSDGSRNLVMVDDRADSAAPSFSSLADDSSTYFFEEKFKGVSNPELANTSTIPGWDLIHTPPRKFPRGALVGTVVSDKMEKTINVAVDRYKIVPKIRKRMRYTRKFMAHDEQELACMGDLVMITPCHRLSKRKHFLLREIIRAKGQL